jgi:serine/threonine-protein kinase
MLPGHTLASRYRIESKIGQGGTAAVFRAFDPQMDRAVAVKLFPTDVIGNRAAVEQFTTELKVIGQLEHPNILPIYDCGRDGDTPFIVMRFADKGSLADELTRGIPAPARTADVIDQAARGLNYAHQRNMIHRDLKPQNILVEASGDVYLADFSLAILDPPAPAAAETGVATGTAYYMSPEQCKGDAVNGRSDVYLLGATLYEMCAGRRPYEGANWADIVVQVLSETPPPLPRDLNPDLPDGVQDVILKAMARNPEERFATALELSAALREYWK